MYTMLDTYIRLIKDNISDPLPGIPGNVKLPFIGSTIEFARDINNELVKNWVKYGNVFKIRVIGEHIVVLIGPEANKLMLHDDQDSFLSKDGWKFILGDLFTDAIMLTDGEEHTRYRRIMQSAFHKEPMTGYLKVIEEEVVQFIENEINIKRGKILVYPTMVRLTMKIAGRLFFGLDFKPNQLNDIIAVTEASMAPVRYDIPFTLYAKGLQARRNLTEFYRNIIRDKRNNPGEDMFSQMCVAKSENGESFTDEEIINQMIFLMMASHDTTTSSLTSLIYETAKNPKWQDALREEANHFYNQGDMEYQRLKELKVTQMVLNETLRLHPPLIVVPRYAIKDFTFEGKYIPKNTKVAFYIYGTHVMKEIYENPMKFDPGRFDECRNEHKKHPMAFIPFGAGRHVCIGKYFAEMESKIFISNFVRKYKWTVPANYTMKYLPPLNKPHDGLPVSIEKIK